MAKCNCEVAVKWGQYPNDQITSHKEATKDHMDDRLYGAALQGLYYSMYILPSSRVFFVKKGLDHYEMNRQHENILVDLKYVRDYTSAYKLCLSS